MSARVWLGTAALPDRGTLEVLPDRGTLGQGTGARAGQAMVPHPRPGLQCITSHPRHSQAPLHPGMVPHPQEAPRVPHRQEVLHPQPIQAMAGPAQGSRIQLTPHQTAAKAEATQSDWEIQGSGGLC